jgi:hypothetical protein
MNRHGGKDGFADGISPVGSRRPDYLSYLVRLWRVGQGREACWRASLQRPGTEEPIWFTDLEEMLAYLRAEAGGLRSG